MELKLMFQPIHDHQYIKSLIENERDTEVIELAYLKDIVYDRQTVYVLEWFRQHEFVLRRYYIFLQPVNGDLTKLQPIGSGSGSYPLLFERDQDLGVAKDIFFKDIEVFQEKGEY